MEDLPKIANDDGKKEIEITFTRFICIGASQPHDHPHVALEIGKNKQRKRRKKRKKRRENVVKMCDGCEILLMYQEEVKEGKGASVFVFLFEIFETF